MEIAAIYHRTANQYAYPLNQDELIINLKTGYDVDRVYIIQGDPYLAAYPIVRLSLIRYPPVRLPLLPHLHSHSNS